jgi:hypothetical protein
MLPVVPSRFKRAHRTHALMQPAGQPYPHLDFGHASASTKADQQLLASFRELCERLPDAAKRAKMLGVSAETEAAWSRGVALPLLRAHRRTLEQALQDAATR